MENMVEDYKIMSLRQMSKKYGVSAMTIKKRLNKLGVDTSHGKSIRPDLLNDRDGLKQQVDEGRSLDDIAKSAGVDKRTVKAALNRKTDEEVYYCNWREHFKSHEQCSKWLLRYGFKHPKLSSTALSKAYESMIKVEPCLNANFNNPATMSFIKHFAEHFYYSTHKGYNSVPDAWKKGNTIVLKNAVKMMWEHNKKCNIFNLVKVIARHFRDFTTVSVFKPWIASYVYDKYLPNGGVVVDPTMGWGGRVIGCIGRNIKYIGYDFNKNAVDTNSKIIEYINSVRNVDASVKLADSSNEVLANGDLLFTSPPYDDTEHYYGVDSTNTDAKGILNNIFSFSGIIALNLPIRQKEMCVNIATQHDKKLVEELKMSTTSFMGREKTYEPILVFK